MTREFESENPMTEEVSFPNRAHDLIGPRARLALRIDELGRKIREHQGAIRLLERERANADAKLQQLKAANRLSQLPPSAASLEE